MEEKPFTIESFYQFCSEGKFMGAKCNKCGKILVPPKPTCPICGSRKFMWVELKRKGEVKTFTIIHVAPQQFASLAPYAVGIVELEDGVKLPGMIKDVELNKLKVGLKVKVEFEEAEGEGWPHWPRYYFKPIENPTNY
ncbi:MAG: Zn-ribbon domain-containing OB-fold protein [archaeon GB-1867-005]|nr:Zn-ribbon domain-containing OB-fold protein [Candidatus Culexmicrobium cathedralense]